MGMICKTQTQHIRVSLALPPQQRVLPEAAKLLQVAWCVGGAEQLRQEGCRTMEQQHGEG